MLRIAALLAGVAFIFAGVAGFMPQFTSDGLLFGIFQVNEMHNLVHIVSGAIALFVALKATYSKLFFEIFGIIYAIVALLGFILNGDLSFIMMTFNLADNILHTGIAVVFLYLGFMTSTQI